MKTNTYNRVVVYDRLDNNTVISRHKNWALAERAAERLGHGDRYGLKLEYPDRPDCPQD